MGMCIGCANYNSCGSDNAATCDKYVKIVSTITTGNTVDVTNLVYKIHLQSLKAFYQSMIRGNLDENNYAERMIKLINKL